MILQIDNLILIATENWLLLGPMHQNFYAYLFDQKKNFYAYKSFHFQTIYVDQILITDMVGMHRIMENARN